MMKKTALAIAAALSLGAVTAPAQAEPIGNNAFISQALQMTSIMQNVDGEHTSTVGYGRHKHGHGRNHHGGHKYDRRHYRPDRDHDRYDRYNRHDRHRHHSRRYWHDNGRYYCRRNDGTTGLLVGGALGAIIGGSIDDRGSDVEGTIIGGTTGALIGRAIDRGEVRCR